MSLVVNLTGQRSPDVIGRLSVSRHVIGKDLCISYLRASKCAWSLGSLSTSRSLSTL